MNNPNAIAIIPIAIYIWNTTKVKYMKVITKNKKINIDFMVLKYTWLKI